MNKKRVCSSQDFEVLARLRKDVIVKAYALSRLNEHAQPSRTMEVRGQEPLKNTRMHILPFAPTDRSPIGISIPGVPVHAACKSRDSLSANAREARRYDDGWPAASPMGEIKKNDFASVPTVPSRLVITVRLSATSSNNSRARFY